MNRFFLFAGSNYYPEGGVDDLVGEYASVEAAQVSIDITRFDWAHIVEYSDGKLNIVAHIRHGKWAVSCVQL